MFHVFVFNYSLLLGGNTTTMCKHNETPTYEVDLDWILVGSWLDLGCILVGPWLDLGQVSLHIGQCTVDLGLILVEPGWILVDLISADLVNIM